MVSDPRVAADAGPIDVSPSGSIAAGGEERSNFESRVYRGKEGGLTKFYGTAEGMDYLYITNGSGEDVIATAIGAPDSQTPIPPATSITLEAPGKVRGYVIENDGSNPINTGSDDAVNAQVGNNRPAPERGFSPSRALEDVIPGLRL